VQTAEATSTPDPTVVIPMIIIYIPEEGAVKVPDISKADIAVPSWKLSKVCSSAASKFLS
jgi:hypothetical protein